MKSIEYMPPELCAQNAYNCGNDHEKKCDCYIIQIDVVSWVCKILNPYRYCDEVAQSQQHPTAKQIAKKAIFPNQAQVLPWIPYCSNRK